MDGNINYGAIKFTVHLVLPSEKYRPRELFIQRNSYSGHKKKLSLNKLNSGSVFSAKYLKSQLVWSRLN